MVSALQCWGFGVALPFVLQRAQRGKQLLSPLQRSLCWRRFVLLLSNRVSVLPVSDPWCPAIHQQSQPWELVGDQGVEISLGCALHPQTAPSRLCDRLVQVAAGKAALARFGERRVTPAVRPGPESRTCCGGSFTLRRRFQFDSMCQAAPGIVT